MGTEALGEAARAVQGPPGGLSLCQRPGTRWPLAEGSHLLASGRGQQLAGSEARELLSRVVLPSELSATGLGGLSRLLSRFSPYLAYLESLAPRHLSVSGARATTARVYGGPVARR